MELLEKWIVNSEQRKWLKFVLMETREFLKEEKKLL
jgi:hypothetical protein